MSPRLLTLCLSLSSLLAQAENRIILNGEEFRLDTIYHVTTGPGMLTTGVRLSGDSSSNQAIETNIFYTSVDLRNPNLELRGVQALDTELASENILQMGTRKNKAGNGRYVAGVNGDHANLSGSAKRTNGLAMTEGMFYNYGVGDENWKRFGSYVAVEGSKEITITDELEAVIALKFPNGQSHDIGINTPRHEDDLIVYTSEYGATTKTNQWGRECAMKLVAGSLAGGDAEFEITSRWAGDLSGDPTHGNMTIPTDGYVLSGHGTGYNIIGSLNVGDRVNIQGIRFNINGRITTADNVIGGCPLIIDDGIPVSTATCIELNKTTAIQITPTARTAIGCDKDRQTLYLLVTDSYKNNAYTTGDKSTYGNTSSGLDFQHLAAFMIYIGCHTATAMDGGGSSQLYNIERGICNIPYGNAGYLRPVANGFFAVSTTPDDNEIHYVEVLQKNIRLSSGETFTPIVYGYNKYGELIDTDITDFTLTVNSSLGTVTGRTFKAGSAKASTTAIVTFGDKQCGVNISVNGGEQFVSSGGNVNIKTPVPYLSDDPAAIYDQVRDKDRPIHYYNIRGIKIFRPDKGVYIATDGQTAVKTYR